MKDLEHTGEPIYLGDLHYQFQPYDVADLKDVTWYPLEPGADYNSSGENGYITGTVVKGGTTSRLLHCRSTKAWKEGEQRTFHYIPLSRIWERKGGGWSYTGIAS